MKIESNNPERVSGNEIADIEADIVSLIKESNELKSKLRMREEESNKGAKKHFLDLLEIVDSFERVFENIEPQISEADKRTKIWIGNFKSIRRLLEKVLKEAGVTGIEAPDGKAIPGFHIILETRQVDGLGDDVIIEEKLKGYLRLGEVLRKSEVITVKNNTAMEEK